MSEHPADGQQSDLSVLLERVANGDAVARDQLASQVYGELRRIAARYMRREAGNHSLQITGLVNEAYLRMQQNGFRTTAKGRAFFFYSAAAAMRQSPCRSCPAPPRCEAWRRPDAARN